MKSRTPMLAALALASLVLPVMVSAEPLIWNGTLEDASRPAQGLYDFEVRVFDRRQGGQPLGSAQSFWGVRLEQGQFELPITLSPLFKSGGELWLEVSARGAGDVHFEALPARALAKGGSNTCWSTGGNVMLPNTGFLGTTNEDSLLDFRVGNRRFWRAFFDPNAPESPIILGGHDSNFGFRPGSVIAGGGRGGADANIVFADYGTISGGYGNQAGILNNAENTGATVAGGFTNRAQGSRSVVGGGDLNIASGNSSTVSGGTSNTASGGLSAVGGGGLNQATGSFGAIGGGAFNLVAEYGTVAGGGGNKAGEQATVGGGFTNEAEGLGATIPGGIGNTASAAGSFAAGRSARATHAGSFVWSDGGEAGFGSTAANQFRIRASGGVYLRGSLLNVTGPDLGAGGPIEFVVEAAKAQAYLFSNSSDTLGSTLALSEMNNSNFVNTWAIARETTSGGNGLRFAFGTSATANSNTVRVKFNSNGTVFKSGGGTAWDQVSDARLKRELGPVDDALGQLLQLRGVRFEYLDEASPFGIELPKGEQIGLMAQEVREVFPDWVEEAEDGTLSVGERGTTALLVEALRELSERNAALEARIEALERSRVMH